MNVPNNVFVVQRRLRLALDANKHCGVPPMLLATRRLAYVEHGPMSHGGEREVLTLVSEEGGYWYGHVLKLPPGRSALDDGRDWLAILVLAARRIDGSTPEEVLLRAREVLVRRCQYEPCYAQDPEDTFSLQPTFEKACGALERIVRRFDPARRTETTMDDFGLQNVPPPGHLDLRCMDVYGLSCDAMREDEERRPHR